MDFILHRLAVGSVRDAKACPEDIDAMLCVAAECALPPCPVTTHKIPMLDMQPIPVEQLREAVGWIRERLGRERVLVYCNAGVGRSSSVAVAYLCCSLGLSFGEAVERVARKRPYMSILPELILGVEELCRSEDERPE